MSSAASNASNNKVVLITGATRGIGLGLAEVYAKKGWRVVATARDPAKAQPLQTLTNTYKSLSVVQLSVDDSKSVAALPAALASIGVTAIDVLFNNAGISEADTPRPSLATLETESVLDFAGVYRTNVIGVWEVTKVLLPLLRAAKTSPRLVNVSSSLGSVQLTLDGPFAGLLPAYRASKAALNELSAVQAREYNEASVKAAADSKTAATAAPLITVIVLNPGWVDTDLGSAKGLKPPLTVDQSVNSIEKTISTVQTSAKSLYLDYDGKALPW